MTDVTVIVPSYRDNDTLERCLRALVDQDFEGSFEVIVSASADETDGLPVLGPHPQVRVLAHVPRLASRDARHRAIDEARGDLFAFTDADAVPDPTWLRELIAASRDGTHLVGGAVVNGTPRSWTGTAEYLAEFSDLSPNRPPAAAWHGALCNLLIPRTLWQRYGPFETLGGGGHDTVITTRARADGRYVFAPTARVTHLNRTGVRAVVRHQHQLGRYAAHTARFRSPYRGRFLVRHTVLAPVAAIARLGAAEIRAVRWMRGQRVRSLATFPLLVVMFAAWGVGLATEGFTLDRRACARRPRSDAVER